MDIEFARTFLAVAETRSFVKAAERLNVTQSTVSARIRVLEDQLGRPVFVRNRAGVTLTAAGAQFEPHASSLVRIWQQARQAASLPPAQQMMLTIGAQQNLWEGVVIDWVGWLRLNHPEIALRTEGGTDDALMRQLVDGLLDVAVVHTPQARSGIDTEVLFEEALILVTTDPPTSRARRVEYVFVDWGAEFRAGHAAAFPDADAAPLYFGNGTAALAYVLRHGGRGYFQLRLAEPHIAAGRLFPVRRAPRFRRPAYAAYYRQDAEGRLGEPLDGLRMICRRFRGESAAA